MSTVPNRTAFTAMPTGSKEAGTSKRPVTPTTNAKYGLHQHGYILGKTIGTGAYGKVKTAHALKMSKQVAVKIIHKRTAPQDMLSKFLPREIETMKLLDHQNVIKLYEVITTEDVLFLVMELAEGGDLLDFINSRKYLSEPTARALFTDLTNGLAACHSLYVVHRDLKCENLLLDSQLRLKLSDFGFARTFERGKMLETYCGSYAYAAPEVILGEPYDGEAADIWSIGVILYAMVVGKLPFKDSDVKTLLGDVATKLVFPNRVTQECNNLIRKILTFASKDRISLETIAKHPWMTKKTEDDPDIKKLSIKDVPVPEAKESQAKVHDLTETERPENSTGQPTVRVPSSSRQKGDKMAEKGK